METVCYYDFLVLRSGSITQVALVLENLGCRHQIFYLLLLIYFVLAVAACSWLVAVEVMDLSLHSS